MVREQSNVDKCLKPRYPAVVRLFSVEMTASRNTRDVRRVPGRFEAGQLGLGGDEPESRPVGEAKAQALIAGLHHQAAKPFPVVSTRRLSGFLFLRPGGRRPKMGSLQRGKT